MTGIRPVTVGPDQTDRARREGPGCGRGWSCTKRSAAMPAARSSRFGRWRSGTGCTGARSGQRWCRRSGTVVPVRVAPKLEAAEPLIDAMLVEDLTAWRKQQHTARRVLARFVDEHGRTELTYSAVRDYVAKRRSEIHAAASKTVGRRSTQTWPERARLAADAASQGNCDIR